MIAFENIAWSAGKGQFQLTDVSFTVPDGAYAVLMGKTGCGKTTVLEILCGLRDPADGKVTVAGQDVTRLAPGERGIGYVPQDGAMFPTYTVREHLAFGLQIRERPATEIEARVQELAGQLEITHLLPRRPHDLSGGERQRVALGRALAAKPAVLLLDEPLSALDEDTRDEIAALLKSTQRQNRVTALHITHSQREADQLADVLLRMQEGRILPVARVARPDNIAG